MGGHSFGMDAIVLSFFMSKAAKTLEEKKKMKKKKTVKNKFPLFSLSLALPVYFNSTIDSNLHRSFNFSFRKISLFLSLPTIFNFFSSTTF